MVKTKVSYQSIFNVKNKEVYFDIECFGEMYFKELSKNKLVRNIKISKEKENENQDKEDELPETA